MCQPVATPAIPQLRFMRAFLGPTLEACQPLAPSFIDMALQGMKQTEDAWEALLARESRSTYSGSQRSRLNSAAADAASSSMDSGAGRRSSSPLYDGSSSNGGSGGRATTLPCSHAGAAARQSANGTAAAGHACAQEQLHSHQGAHGQHACEHAPVSGHGGAQGQNDHQPSGSDAHLSSSNCQEGMCTSHALPDAASLQRQPGTADGQPER